MSNAISVLLEANGLKPGERIEYDFPSKKSATSFRTSLYAAKKRLGDNAILIEINGNTVSISREENAVKKRLVAADGTATEIPSQFVNRTEIALDYLQRAKELGLSEDQTEEFLHELLSKQEETPAK